MKNQTLPTHHLSDYDALQSTIIMTTLITLSVCGLGLTFWLWLCGKTTPTYFPNVADNQNTEDHAVRTDYIILNQPSV